MVALLAVAGVVSVALSFGVVWAGALLTLLPLLESRLTPGFRGMWLASAVLLSPMGPLFFVGDWPVTLGKWAVAVSLLQQLVLGRPLWRSHILTRPLMLFLVVMGLSAWIAGTREALVSYSSLITLVAFVHHLPAVLMAEDVTRVGHALAITVLLLIWWYFPAHVALVSHLADDAGWTQRATGHAGSPNDWAMFIVILAPLVLRPFPGKWGDIVETLLLGLLPVAVIQSMSRSGLLVMVALLPWVIWEHRHRLRMLLVAGLISVATALLFVPLEAANSRIISLANPSMEMQLGHASLRQRADLLQVGWLLFWEHPWFGVGIDRFTEIARPFLHWNRPLAAHNTWLKLAVETGIFGTTSVSWMLYRGWRSWGVLRTHTDEQQHKIVPAIGWGLAAAFGFSMTADRLDDAQTWLLLGLLITMMPVSSGEPPDVAA